MPLVRKSNINNIYFLNCIKNINYGYCNIFILALTATVVATKKQTFFFFTVVFHKSIKNRSNILTATFGNAFCPKLGIALVYSWIMQTFIVKCQLVLVICLLISLIAHVKNLPKTKMIPLHCLGIVFVKIRNVATMKKSINQ